VRSFFHSYTTKLKIRRRCASQTGANLEKDTAPTHHPSVRVNDKKVRNPSASDPTISTKFGVMIATSVGMSWSQPGAEKIFIKSRLDLGRNHQFQTTTQGQTLEKF
jgi:hypothetical protein